MLFLFSRISTWLFIEMLGTSVLVVLNLIIPILMIFTAYRNLTNFYFSSAALSSSLINCLYLFYLIQTIRSKVFSENNCRAIYYLQTSCIVVLAYTITAMHASFVLCLFPSSDQHQSTRTCLQSCGLCLRRFFRRFCFCFVLCVWSLSFTSTIPLLYTIDSNEKSPKPVYCPGTTQISYLEELFDRNRFTQNLIFNLIPLLLTLFLSCIALLKLFYDCLAYFYVRLKMSKCSPFRKKSSRNSVVLLASFANNNLATINDSSSDLPIQSYRRWFSTSFLRFILVSSCCLLACIYPIVMRFYLVYFSVLVPLIFAVFNYSLGQLPSTQQQQTIMENHNTTMATPSILRHNSLNVNFNKILQTNERDNSVNERIELRSPLIANLLNNRDTLSGTSSSSSTIFSTPHQHRSNIRGKRKYFTNHLYENTRNLLIK